MCMLYISVCYPQMIVAYHLEMATYLLLDLLAPIILVLISKLYSDIFTIIQICKDLTTKRVLYMSLPLSKYAKT